MSEFERRAHKHLRKTRVVTALRQPVRPGAMQTGVAAMCRGAVLTPAAAEAFAALQLESAGKQYWSAWGRGPIVQVGQGRFAAGARDSCLGIAGFGGKVFAGDVGWVADCLALGI